MAIRLIVTDLDGTFYHPDMTYDQERFRRLQKKMEEEGIRFVVASGNQYYQLISFFDHPEEMTFISENGGLIISEGKELFSSEIGKETVDRILNIIDNIPEITMNLVCGKKAAYVKNDFSDEMYNVCVRYFPKLVRVEDLHHTDDQIIKFALATDESVVDKTAAYLESVAGDELSVVTSGHGDIDIIVKGVHKGFAVKKMCEIWGIKDDEVMAFGDAMNDRQMLEMAGYGFVMKNGNEKLKEIIGRVTPLDHLHDGELELIEEYLDHPEEFLEKYK